MRKPGGFKSAILCAALLIMGCGEDPATMPGITKPSTASWDAPKFPWPMPKHSARGEVERFFDPGEALKWGEAAKRIARALDRSGYANYGFYAVPEGFAIVAQLEQIADDGTPLSGTDRFKDLPVPPKITGPVTYFTATFSARKGRYRAMAFVVTSLPLPQAGATTEKITAKGWATSGDGGMPPDIADTFLTKDHKCHLVVYEFFQESADGQARPVVSGAIGVPQHLAKSSILF